MVNYLLRLGAKILLSGLASVAMYCVWVDTVAPESQNIVQLFVLIQYGVYCLSVLFIFHLDEPQKVIDILFPPLITSAFAAVFWSVPDNLFLFSFVLMFVVSCVFSAAHTIIQRSLLAPYAFPRFSRTVTLSLIGLVTLMVAFIFFATKFHEFQWLLALLSPVFIIVLLLVYSCIFFYSIFTLWFFREKRKWKSWALFLVYSALWIAFIAQTYPVNEWRMRTFVDPCYNESMSGKSPEYDVISGRVCVQMPSFEGPFNISVRKTLIGADPTTFQQIGNSSYYRDSQHVYYGDKILPVNLEDVVVSEKFLLSGGQLFKYGEAVDIEKETKLFQSDDKSFELRYLDSAFTQKEGDFPVHTLSGSCETVRYIWDAFRFNYHYAVMTTGKGCLFQPGENEEFVEEKVISGVSGKLYQNQFDIIWLSESCRGIAYRIIYPRDWNEFFLPQLTLQDSCKKK